MNVPVDVSNGMQAIELCSGKNHPVLNCGFGQRSLTCLMAVIVVYLTFFLLFRIIPVWAQYQKKLWG